MEPNPAPAGWTSPSDLAEELGVSVETVYSWRKNGKGPVAHRIGRHIRFRRSDIEAWLATQRDTIGGAA